MRTRPQSNEIHPFFHHLKETKSKGKSLLALANENGLNYPWLRAVATRQSDGKLQSIKLHVEAARKLGLSLDDYFEGLLATTEEPKNPPQQS